MFGRDTTQRGFGVLPFTDLYGKECSVQASSLASESAIWLGINKAEPIIMASTIIEGGRGWAKYPLPEGVQIDTRMHINREQAAELVKVLQHFADTGELEHPDDI